MVATACTIVFICMGMPPKWIAGRTIHYYDQKSPYTDSMILIILYILSLFRRRLSAIELGKDNQSTGLNG